MAPSEEKDERPFARECCGVLYYNRKKSSDKTCQVLDVFQMGLDRYGPMCRTSAGRGFVRHGPSVGRVPDGACQMLDKCQASAGRGFSCVTQVPGECRSCGGQVPDGACQVVAKCRTSAGPGLSCVCKVPGGAERGLSGVGHRRQGAGRGWSGAGQVPGGVGPGLSCVGQVPGGAERGLSGVGQVPEGACHVLA